MLEKKLSPWVVIIVGVAIGIAGSIIGDPGTWIRFIFQAVSGFVVIIGVILGIIKLIKKGII